MEMGRIHHRYSVFLLLGERIELGEVGNVRVDNGRWDWVVGEVEEANMD